MEYLPEQFVVDEERLYSTARSERIGIVPVEGLVDWDTGLLANVIRTAKFAREYAIHVASGDAGMVDIEGVGTQ
jgi:hypothetical protein